MYEIIQVSFAQYYGIDWLIFISNIAAVWLLGNQDKKGFLIRIGINIAWIFLGAMVHSIPLILAGIVFAVLNLRGFRKWSSKN